ncbi:Hsp20/alpha crystallin family protein [Carboxydothermus pertinax]|uniref:Heat-shock protein n=1 Tax=Carboxydothermus pertinax TaxID=870242 RepID=A0A1L8CWF8_9THEO|nr:Hsp20/alpha crystallin family protein [Carboxydothermus pertinax]GAV23237.1 heat-shock protein [Carboxydothermus pertinax]
MLMRFDPFKEIFDLNRWFAEAFTPINRSLSLPRIDILDEGEELLVKAELPGIEDKNQIELYVQNDYLILKGQVQDETEAKSDRYYRKERFSGSFERVVYLPVEVEPAKASAEYKNGILNIRLKKAQGSQKGFKIDIQ